MGISPIVREITKEEQLPITAITAPSDENQAADEIPTSYSSDIDDDSSSSTSN